MKSQLTDVASDGRDNLFAQIEGPGSTTGRFGDRSRPMSLYTRLYELRPIPVKAMLALLVGSVALWRLARS